eukprot:CAMPEP_0195590304 /NCGR_PEP_ID=MMETSP0814-20130614/34071_1 /TAXON_ID=97485 /ORGANISM="Prymnesium parvum, Strain Texoma1" /LENGTH=206 /DNA_ID=CAMNT_0040729339 /DNA_START=335 /DNA_END=956 /DNA_ORIENTATION=+
MPGEVLCLGLRVAGLTPCHVAPPRVSPLNHRPPWPTWMSGATTVGGAAVSELTKVGLRRPLDAHEQAAELDARSQRAAQPENTVAAPQPSQHRRLVRRRLALVAYADVQKRRVRLGGEAPEGLAELGAQAVALDCGCGELGVHAALDDRLRADGTETSNGVQRECDRRGAGLPKVRGRGFAAELRHELVAHAAPAAVLRAMLTPLR